MDPSLITQFGLPVAYTVVLTAVVAFLYKRGDVAHEAELARERERGDRLESELRSLNEHMRDRVVPALVEANRVNAEAAKSIGEITATVAMMRKWP
jgi:hypothetical protein